ERSAVAWALPGVSCSTRSRSAVAPFTRPPINRSRAPWDRKCASTAEPGTSASARKTPPLSPRGNADRDAGSAFSFAADGPRFQRASIEKRRIVKRPLHGIARVYDDNRTRRCATRRRGGLAGTQRDRAGRILYRHATFQNSHASFVLRDLNDELGTFDRGIYE